MPAQLLPSDDRSGRATWALPPRLRRSSNSSCSTRRRTACAKKAYRNLKNLTPGWFGYSMLRSSVEFGFLSRADEALRSTWTCRSRGFTPKRGPACWKRRLNIPTRCRGRPRRDLQDLLESAGRTAGQDADLHGQMVERLSGTVRAICIFRSGTRRQARLPSRRESPARCRTDALVRWRTAGLMPELLAMVASTVNSYSRLIPVSGRRPTRPGVSRTAPARCASFQARRRASGSNTGSRQPTSILISLSRRRWVRVYGGSRTGSSPTLRSRQLPMISPRTRANGPSPDA